MVFRIQRSIDRTSMNSKSVNTFFINMDHISVISDFTQYDDNIKFEIIMNNGKNYYVVTYLSLFDQYTRKHLNIDKEKSINKFKTSYSKIINDWVKCIEFEKEREIGWYNYDFTHILVEEKNKEEKSNVDNLDLNELKEGINLVKKYTNNDIHVK